MAQLLRVDDRADALDLSVGDVERERAHDVPLPVDGQGAGLAVDLHGSDREPVDALGAPHPVDQRLRDRSTSEHRAGDGPNLAAAVAVQRDIVSQHCLQGVQVA